MVEEEDGVPTDPVGCNSEAKSVEGVDGQDSVRSSIGPPASSSKRSNQKGMGKKPPKKKKNGSDDVPYLHQQLQNPAVHVAINEQRCRANPIVQRQRWMTFPLILKVAILKRSL